MGKLTKEQKMEMLSNAIDAGFNIQIKKYRVESLEEMNEALDVFPGLSVRFHGIKDKKSAWVNINERSHGNDSDNFEATIFLK